MRRDPARDGWCFVMAAGMGAVIGTMVHFRFGPAAPYLGGAALMFLGMWRVHRIDGRESWGRIRPRRG